jgi:DNA-directed RNA polymerase specialized sigma subunit
MSEALDKSIKELTALEMLILYLKLERHLTLKDIGELLGMSYQTVNNNLNKVYESIKKNLQ